MLETVITSSVLILVITFVRFIFRNSLGRRLRYALWGLVLLRLIAPVSIISSPVSILNALNPRQTAVFAESVPPVFPGDFIMAQITYPDETSASGEIISRTAPGGHDSANKAQPMPDTWQFLRFSWITGALLTAIWFLCVNLSFYLGLRKTRQPFSVKDYALPVYITGKRRSPFLFGLVKPSVYLTPEVLTDTASLRYVLAHEYAHYRHLDHIWQLLRVAVLCVYWFNPLVWLAAQLSRADCELACDEAVIRSLGSECIAEYGRVLIRLIPVKKAALLPLCATTMTAGIRGMKARITMIVQNKKTAISALAATVIIVAAAVGCTFTGADISAPPSEPPETQETDGSVPLSADNSNPVGDEPEADNTLFTEKQTELERLFKNIRADKYSGVISFIIPDGSVKSEEWYISVSGRKETAAGGMSVHMFDEENDKKLWNPGMTYSIDLTDSSYTELYLTASILTEQDGIWGTFVTDSIDLLDLLAQSRTSLYYGNQYISVEDAVQSIAGLYFYYADYSNFKFQETGGSGGTMFPAYVIVDTHERTHPAEIITQATVYALLSNTVYDLTHSGDNTLLGTENSGIRCAVFNLIKNTGEDDAEYYTLDSYSISDPEFFERHVNEMFPPELAAEVLSTDKYEIELNRQREIFTNAFSKGEG